LSAIPKKPISLVPQFLDPQLYFKPKQTKVDFDFNVDKDVEHLKSLLIQLKQKGNPTFEITIQTSFHSPRSIFQTDGHLVSINTNPTDLLNALENNINLCKHRR
jgi:hypothetical protein